MPEGNTKYYKTCPLINLNEKSYTREEVCSRDEDVWTRNCGLLWFMNDGKVNKNAICTAKDYPEIDISGEIADSPCCTLDKEQIQYPITNRCLELNDCKKCGSEASPSWLLNFKEEHRVRAVEIMPPHDMINEGGNDGEYIVYVLNEEKGYVKCGSFDSLDKNARVECDVVGNSISFGRKGDSLRFCGIRVFGEEFE